MSHDWRRRAGAACVVVLTTAGLAACGSGGAASVSVPRVAAARTFTLGGFTPAGPITAGRATTVSFTVRLPNGSALTRYKNGSGPHTGVHLIIVRDDLAYIIHEHPPISASGLLTQRVVFPAPGPYRVLVDIYPNLPGSLPNFQLFRSVNVAGAYRPRPLPAFHASQTVHGYHFVVHGRPALHAIQAQFIHVTVTDPHGRSVRFKPWFGALAHAIFFRQGTLDYFHTHICAPSAPNCGSLPGVGSSRVSGRATGAGQLTLGVLLPLPGTWELFLQMKPAGQVITAPFTLHVSS